MDDGHLSVSEEVRQELGLKKGDRVEVTVKRPELSKTSQRERLSLSTVVISSDTSLEQQIRETLRSFGQANVRMQFYPRLDNQTSDEIRSMAPDIIVVNLLPDKEEGIRTVERMAEISERSRIFVLGEGTDVDMILRSMRSGASEFLTTPFENQTLLAALERLTKARAAGVDLDNPLVQLMAICQGDNKSDFSLKHDRDLYLEDEH
ncbi:MAG: response regulator [Gammaproteobacteria bacterium]